MNECAAVALVSHSAYEINVIKKGITSCAERAADVDMMQTADLRFKEGTN